MADDRPCPDAQVLQKFVLGTLPPHDADQLGGHVEHCKQCVITLDGLKADDTLLAVMRRPAEPLDEPEPELIEQLLRAVQSAEVGSQGSEVKGQRSEVGEEDLTVDERARRRPGLVLSHGGPAIDLQAFLTPPRGPDEIGRLGPYRILKVLGTGGMGIVFQAEDPELKRLVALKVMKPDLARQADARQRFRREAQAAAAISHDHIVSIFQVGEERGVPFLAMPLLEGEALEDRLKRDGPLPIDEAVRIGREIAEGLDAAHSRGLIHRDIKPANVWLESRGRGDAEKEGRRERGTKRSDAGAGPSSNFPSLPLSVSPSLRPSVTPFRVKIMGGIL